MKVFTLNPDDVENAPREPGTYALLFRVTESHRIRVGRRGELHLTPGWYVYVGSARGPGGLRARLRRHMKREKSLHWHIDYITQHITPHQIVYTLGTTAMECRWVQGLLSVPGTTVPLPNLGNGDCTMGCPAHFLHLPTGEIHSQLTAAFHTGGQR